MIIDVNTEVNYLSTTLNRIEQLTSEEAFSLSFIVLYCSVSVGLKTFFSFDFSYSCL